MTRQTIAGLSGRIATLEAEKTALQGEIDALKSTLELERASARLGLEKSEKEKFDALTQKDSEFNAKFAQLGEQIKKLELEIQEKQKEINLRELKKFAEAYEEQETIQGDNSEKWFKYAAWVSVGLLVATLLIVIFTQGLPWSKKASFYFLDIILITLWVFSLKQYSYYVKLRTDYGNRKTLAQSYYNIINSADDAVIKNKFLDKASEVFAARAEVDDEAYTIPEKFLDSITELAKTLRK